jgi:RNA polymerase sigma-70 factor (ECF subfamily)
MSAPEGKLVPPRTFIDSLPAAARRVATLVVSGMNKHEITSALRLSETSFRQRLTTIRKAWRKAQAYEDDSESHLEASNPGAGDADLDVGLIRRALLTHVRRLGGVGTHDPDGHLIVLGGLPAHNSRRVGNDSKNRQEN